MSNFLNLNAMNIIYKLMKKTEISRKLTKNVKKVQNQLKKDNFGLSPQEVDQLLHVDQL